MAVIFLLLLSSSSILFVSISPFLPTTYACHCTGLASKPHYSAAKQFSTVNYIKTSGLWTEVSQFNYSVVNIHTCSINTKSYPTTKPIFWEELYKCFQYFTSCFQLNALVYYIPLYSSTCFEPYCAHHQEVLLYIHSIWFLMYHSENNWVI